MRTFSKKSALLLGKLVFAFALFWMLSKSSLFQLSLFNNLVQQPALTFCAILALLLMILLASWRLYILNNSQNISLSFFYTTASTYIGAAFNNILPGAVGGDLIRSLYLFKKIPSKRSYLLFSLLIDRVIGFVGLFVLMSAVFIVRAQSLSQEPKLFYIFLMFSLFCLGMLAVFCALVLASGKFEISLLLNKYFPQQKWAKLAGTFFDAIRHYKIKKSAIIWSVLLSVLVQLIIVCCLKLIATIMGIPTISMSDYIIAASITQVINLIPATPGGIGIGEVAFANILLILNPSIDAAFATVYFAFRLISTISYLPGAVYYVPKMLTAKINVPEVTS